MFIYRIIILSAISLSSFLFLGCSNSIKQANPNLPYSLVDDTKFSSVSQQVETATYSKRNNISINDTNQFDINKANLTLKVVDLPLTETLFRIAKQLNLELDIKHINKSRIKITAEKVSFEEIMYRLQLQVPFNYYLDDNKLVIYGEGKFWHLYRVDYVNLIRNSSSSISMQIALKHNATNMRGLGLNSATIDSKSQSQFWDTLEKNLIKILNNKPNNTKNIVINRDVGVLEIFADINTQIIISRFIKEINKRALKQVLIEASIVEIELTDSFKSGIDWGQVKSDLSVNQNLIGNNLNSAPYFSIVDSNADLNYVLKMLSTYGKSNIISNPKILTLNNQASIIKVVDNEIYFTTDVTITAGTSTTTNTTTYDTKLHTVAVGLIMQLTPFVNKNKEVILDIRPTLSKVVKYVKDPNPELAKANVVSQVPVIQEREMGSLIKLQPGQAILVGGLIQDSKIKVENKVPLLGSIPGLGWFFRYQEDMSKKTELIILLKASVDI